MLAFPPIAVQNSLWLVPLCLRKRLHYHSIKVNSFHLNWVMSQCSVEILVLESVKLNQSVSHDWNTFYGMCWNSHVLANKYHRLLLNPDRQHGSLRQIHKWLLIEFVLLPSNPPKEDDDLIRQSSKKVQLRSRANNSAHVELSSLEHIKAQKRS